MKFLRKKICRVLAACYRAAYLLHHKICLRPDPTLPQKLGTTKLIVVGSYRTGGAGKTPFCLWLTRHLAQQGRTIALLCHSYAYDEIQMYREELEPLQQDLKSQTGSSRLIEIVGTENRYRSALHLLQQQNPPDFIICDDGFEDSRLAGAVNIVLQWETIDNCIRQLWPAGPCRSLPKDHNNRKVLNLRCQDDVDFQIDRIANSQNEILPQTLGNYPKARAVCGIGNPQRFLRDLKACGVIPEDNRFLRDHDRGFPRTLENLLKQFPHDAIIITQKDACRLNRELRNHPNVFTVYQKTSVSKSAILNLEQALTAP